MKKNKILERAENTITKYKNDDSIYYRELVKTYKEYKNYDNNDYTRDELYISHINDLCDLIIEKKKSSFTIILMLIVLVLTIGLSGYSTYKYLDISNNLKNNIIKINNSNSLVVNYKNLDSFNALTIKNALNYEDINPLTLNILNSSTSDSNMHYDIYMILDNDELDTNSVIPIEAFQYNIKDNSRDNGIKYLSDATVINSNKIRIFSGTVSANEEIEVSLRMWIDENTDTDYLNKTFRFKLLVDGYVI
jgi:hypothetical protein